MSGWKRLPCDTLLPMDSKRWDGLQLPWNSGHEHPQPAHTHCWFCSRVTFHLQLPCGVEGDLALPPQPCIPCTPHGRCWATLMPGQQLLKTAVLQAAAPNLQEAGANWPEPFLWTLSGL